MNKIAPFVRENFRKTDPIQRQIPVWLIMGVKPPGVTPTDGLDVQVVKHLRALKSPKNGEIRQLIAYCI